MSKSDKLGVDKLIKRVTDEFDKAQQRVEKMVSDALSQIDTLQNQVQELRDAVKGRVGLGGSDSASKGKSKTKGKSGSSAEGTTSAKKPAASAKKTTSSGSSKPAASKKTTTAKKSSAAASKTTGASKKTAAKKAGNDTDLTRIKGIGPAMADKMRAKGITSIKQIANPSADDKKKLADFSHLKSFSSWQSEAKKLV